MRRLRPGIVGLVVAVAVLGAPGGAGSSSIGTGVEAVPVKSTGELRVRERRMDTGSVYVEGAYQYLSVRRTRDNRLMYRIRSANPIRARLRLRRGYYRVASWTRSCVGTCDRLDPPSGRCRGHFRVRAGRYVTATIRSGVGVHCRVVNP
jgi:hypothetical protein